VLTLTLNGCSSDDTMGTLLGGPSGPWTTQNFGWVAHNAFGTPNNLACMFVSSTTAKKQIYVAITAFCGFCDKLAADRIFADISKS